MYHGPYLVPATHFDYRGIPIPAEQLPERHDSTAVEAGKREECVQFGGVTVDNAVAGPGLRKQKSVFDFKFGGQGLNRKESIPKIFNQREETHEAAPGRQLKRKRRFSNLNILARADATEATHRPSAASAEDHAVRTLRRSFSKAALRLGISKRKHEEEDDVQAAELEARPTKKVCLPEIDASLSTWSSRVENAFEGVLSGEMAGIEICSPPLQQQQQDLRLFELGPGHPEVRQTVHRPHLARDALAEKQVHETTLEILEGRQLVPAQPLTFQQIRDLRAYARGQIHPAFRQPESMILELPGSVPAVELDSRPLNRVAPSEMPGDLSRRDREESISPTSMFSITAMLDAAIAEQFEVIGSDPLFGTSGIRRRRLQEAVGGFGGWDEFAAAVAEQ